MKKIALLFILALNVQARAAEVISFAVGTLQGDAITAREVQLQHLLGEALEEKSTKPVKAGLLVTDGKDFAAAAQESLRNAAIATEATTFNVVTIPPDEEAALKAQVQTRLHGNGAWKELQVSGGELTHQLHRRLLARKFIQFREQNSVLPVTDTEATNEFSENHKKYGELTFAKAKENIKSILSRAQVERRMKDWYDGIENKYHVKNLVAGSFSD